MNRVLTVAVLLFVSASLYAQGAKPCEELKAEIAKKVEANNVKSYTLEIVATEKATETEGKVVGSCEGGTKKIVYRKTAPAPQKPAAAPSKP